MTATTERRITYSDFKRIYLPIGDWNLIPPSEGIYDEPTVYYKANIKWAPLIEGFVSWLTEITAWENAEDENYSGIQAIMTFLERIVIEIDCADVEDCLGSSTIINNMITNITNNTTNITNNTTVINEVVNEVDEVQRQLGTTNQVPSPADYADDDLCNAADYATQKLIDIANDVFNKKNSSNYAAWLENALFNTGGYIANALETVWDAIDGNYAGLAAELIAADPYIKQILFDNRLERENAITDVLADTHISAAAKSAAASILAALTDGMFDEWGFVGKESNAGGCIATTGWAWSYPATACTYGLPSGWTINIGAAACGDGVGSFDGIFRTRNGVAAEVTVILTLPAPIQLDVIRVNAECNLVSGFNDGNLTVTVHNGTTQLFTNSQVLPRTGFTAHNFTPVVLGDKITIYGVQTYLSTNPTGIVFNKISVNAALL